MRESEENGLVDLFIGGKDDEIAQKQNMNERPKKLLGNASFHE